MQTGVCAACALLVLQASCYSILGDDNAQMHLCWVSCSNPAVLTLAIAYTIPLCKCLSDDDDSKAFQCAISHTSSCPLAASPISLISMVLCVQGRSPFGSKSPFGSSISGMSLASSADRPSSGIAYFSGASGVAYFSGVDSPMSASSVATHSSEVLDGHMEVSGDAAPSSAFQAEPCPCIKCHVSVNVRSTPFQNHFIPHDDIGEQAMMPKGLLD